MNVHLPLCVFLLAVPSISTAAEADREEVYLELKGSDIFERAIIVSTLSRSSAEALSRTFLAGYAGRLKVTKFVVGTSVDNVAAQVGGGPAATFEIPYPGWRANREQELRRDRLGPIAETIAISGAAVMRWRGLGGEITRSSLANDDPLRFQIEGAMIEIMHVRIGKSGPVQLLELPDESYAISYYARTDAPLTAAFARRVAEGIASRTGLRQLTLELRQDGLFHSAWFPNVYRFGPALSVPSREEYLQRPAAFCSFIRGGYRCSAHDPQE